MTWHSTQPDFDLSAYLQGLAGESSPTSFSDTAQSEPSSLKSTPETSSSNGSGTASSRPSPSGTTCEPSTASHGADALISSRGGSPVSTSVAQAMGRESLDSTPDCGLRWPALSARYSRRTCSWKIHPCLFPEGLIECSVILPKWGTMRGGVLSVLDTPADFAPGTAYGFWPAPIKSDTNGGATPVVYQGQAKRWARTSKTNGQEYGGKLRDAGRLMIGLRYASPDLSELVIRWPMGWTGLQPLAMGRMQEWLRSHGACSGEDDE